MKISTRDVPEQRAVTETRTVDQAGLREWLPEVQVGAPVATGGDRIVPAHREAFARVTKAQVLSGQLGGVRLRPGRRRPGLRRGAARHQRHSLSAPAPGTAPGCRTPRTAAGGR